ncbi:exodeoxyribonuclease III [Candidatus Blochmanniella floridana]|uniref:Exodeoxyribonuclease III n=1 Tax=Blochmanniella floridana TaxID=203907 RepID=Q7VQZ5_BLOFL|nr:exodeoxyribonuclease III [Candidatus Blochmannia floridanus]
MRFVSFNINGLRAHMHQLDALITQLKPDVIGLQETKVHDDIFPVKIIEQYGYYVHFYGQKKYYGVAFLFKYPPITVTQGNVYDSLSSQKRTIIAQIVTKIGILTIINCYCPQGENYHSNKFLFKRQFFQNLQHYIENTYNNQSILLIMGDLNISPTDLDVGISEQNKKRWIKSGKCSFLPEERSWIHSLMKWGLIDIYRKNNPYNNKRYSWFSYKYDGFHKNKGLRIDLILVTQPLENLYINGDISYDIRGMPNSSDHAPIWVDFDI